MIALVFGLVLLHGLDGREVYVNPKNVTTMRAAVPGEKNKRLAEEARCALNTTDGKFISVIETCEAVRSLIRQLEGKEP